MSEKLYTLTLRDNRTGKSYTLQTDCVIAYAGGEVADELTMTTPAGIHAAIKGGGTMIVGRLCGLDLLNMFAQLDNKLGKDYPVRGIMRSIAEGKTTAVSVSHRMEADPDE